MEFQYLNTREYTPAQSDRHTSIIISNICTVPTAELMAMNSQENGLQASFPNNVHFIREFWISCDFQVCLKLRLMLLCLLNSSHLVQWNVLSSGLWRCVEWSESTGVSEEHNAEPILPLPFAAFCRRYSFRFSELMLYVPPKCQLPFTGLEGLICCSIGVPWYFGFKPFYRFPALRQIWRFRIVWTTGTDDLLAKLLLFRCWNCYCKYFLLYSYLHSPVFRITLLFLVACVWCHTVLLYI
jgi:hypothetical protein